MGTHNITIQDKRSPIHNHRSKANTTGRHVANEDETIVLDGPDPTTPLIHTLILDSPMQRFHDSL
jgi:hypothetical protein